MEIRSRRFEGRVALVTGAGGGIGRATAVRLAAEGASLLACDVDAERLAEAADAARDEGGKVETRVFDVREAGACRDAVERAVAAFGRLDVLCNVAGISMIDHMTSFSEAQWRRMLDVNLSSVFFLSQAAVPHLLETKGNIVNMASSAGLEGQAYNSMYCATKAAVVMLSKSMAMEYGARGLRVNAICPGGVLTDIAKNFVPPEGADPKFMDRLMPMLEVARPEEIATAVAYLASDDARYVTGTAFSIDGGQTAG